MVAYPGQLACAVGQIWGLPERLASGVLVKAAELAALLPVLQVTEQTALPKPPHNLWALIPMVAAS